MSKKEIAAKGLNFIFLGDSGVGKSSIIRQYVDGIYTENPTATIGLDFKTKEVKLNTGFKVKVKIWDTAGQERFGSIAKSFYKNSNGVFIVLDVTKAETLKQTNNWIKSIAEEKTSHNYLNVLLANKIDMIDERVISEEEVASLARRNDIKYFEVSAKTGVGISEAFEYMASNVLLKMNVLDEKGKIVDEKQTINLSENSGSTEKKNCC